MKEGAVAHFHPDRPPLHRHVFGGETARTGLDLDNEG